MKSRVTLILTLLMMFVLLSACAREPAEPPLYDVAFLEGSSELFRCSVPEGEYITDIPETDGVWSNEDGEVVDPAEIAVTLVTLSSLAASICLPFMFRYGVEKGRIAYYIMVGVICGGSGFASNVIEWQIFRFSGAVLFSLPLLSFGILALSWFLSIRFYEKREI